MKRAARWVCLGAAVGMLAACGGNVYKPAPAPEDFPEDLRSEGAASSAGVWPVHGYGRAAADAADSVVAGRDLADNDARADMAKRISTLHGHLRESLLAGLGSREQGGLEKADIKAVVKRAGEIAANQSRITHRQRQADGSWYALAVTDFRSALREAAENRGLSAAEVDRLMEAAAGSLQGEADQAAKDEAAAENG